MNTNRPVTMRDIAQKLGYSTNTVSLALRDSDAISAPTKKAILDMAQELGYTPNNSARALRKGKSDEIVILCNRLNNPFFSMYVQSLSEKLKKIKKKCSVIFTLERNFTHKVLFESISNDISAIISFLTPESDVVQILKERHVPLSLIGIRMPNAKDVNLYTYDDEKGGRIVAEEYIRSNAKKAVFITNEHLSEISKKRYLAFQMHIKEHNKSVQKLILPFNYTNNDLNDIATYIQGNDIDFIFSYSDCIGIRLRKILNKRSYQNFTIIGFDNLGSVYDFIEPLDSVGTDINQVCSDCIQDILRQISDNSTTYIWRKYDVSLTRIH